MKPILTWNYHHGVGDAHQPHRLTPEFYVHAEAKIVALSRATDNSALLIQVMKNISKSNKED